MVAGDDGHLFVMIRRPIPEGVLRALLAAEVMAVSGHDEYIARNLQGMILQVARVLGQFQMQIGGVLEA